MNLERLPEYVISTVVVALGILAAIYFGHSSGEGQTKMLLVSGALAVVAYLGMKLKAKIWMLMLCLYPLQGQLPFLPLPLSVRDIGILLAFGWFLIFKALKLIRVKPTYNVLDFILLANLAYLISVFIRNPVGTLAIGGDRIGGRPYVEVIISCMAYWVLLRTKLEVEDVWKLPALMLIGQSITVFLGLVTNFFPMTVPFLSNVYSGIDADAYNAGDLSKNQDGAGPDVVRWGFLGETGTTVILLLCSYFRPFTILNPLYIWRFLGSAIGLVLVLSTGFRNGVVNCVCIIGIASYFRGKAGDMWKMGGVALASLILLVSFNGVLFDLPLVAQRCLSFLPGHWAIEATQDAKASYEWRVYMWKAMLTEDKYIHNRLLGDGFGFSSDQYQTMLHASESADDPTALQEAYMTVGQVHSGPITAIRYVGYIGLAFFLVLVLYMSYSSVAVITEAKATPYFSASIFLCIQIITLPFFYTFLFGSYDIDFPTTIFLAGILKMMQSNIARYKNTGKKPMSVDAVSGLPLKLGAPMRTSALATNRFK